VWLLTNDQPALAAYEVNCERQSGRWHVESGFGGFGGGTPEDVLARDLP